MESEESRKQTFKSTMKRIFLQFFGEFQIGSEFLNSRSNNSSWLPLKIIDGILRGIGQVCFANNPISGAFCLVGLYLGSPIVALAAVVASLSAIISSLIFDQPFCNVTNGLNQFNAVLIGTVLSSLYPALYSGSQKDIELWILIIFGSILSIPIQNGIGNLLNSLTAKTTTFTSEGSFTEKNLGMIAFTFPFNVVGQISFVLLALRAKSLKEPLELVHTNETESQSTLDWLKVVEGSILSMGQVYAVNTLIGSLVMMVGFFLCSPILTLSMSLGGFLGTCTALALLGYDQKSLEAIYTGIYGYNSVLTAGALGGFFVVLTWRSFIRCICGIVLTVTLHIVIGAAYAGNSIVQIPVCTLPFVVACWMLHLNTSHKPTGLSRVSSPSTPEIHLEQFLKACKTRDERS